MVVLGALLLAITIAVACIYQLVAEPSVVETTAAIIPQCRARVRESYDPMLDFNFYVTCGNPLPCSDHPEAGR